jgi:hypothetical protein
MAKPEYNRMTWQLCHTAMWNPRFYALRLPVRRRCKQTYGQLSYIQKSESSLFREAQQMSDVQPHDSDRPSQNGPCRDPISRQNVQIPISFGSGMSKTEMSVGKWTFWFLDIPGKCQAIKPCYALKHPHKRNVPAVPTWQCAQKAEALSDFPFPKVRLLLSVRPY